MKVSNEKLQNIVTKLRKLQNLYEGAKEINSEGEANAAAAAIQRLLTQYNLSMDEIGQEEEKDSVLHEHISGYNFKSIGGKWELRLTTIICNWNFCKCFMYGGSYKNLVIIGKPENIETVKWLKNMLSQRFVEFSNLRWKEFKKSDHFEHNRMTKDKYQRHYLLGCAMGLNEKLKEENDKLNKDKEFETKVTALTTRNEQAISEYIANQFGATSNRKSAQQYSAAAAEGYRDGKNTSINKQVEVTKSKVSKMGLLG